MKRLWRGLRDLGECLNTAPHLVPVLLFLVGFPLIVFLLILTQWWPALRGTLLGGN